MKANSPFLFLLRDSKLRQARQQLVFRRPWSVLTEYSEYEDIPDDEGGHDHEEPEDEDESD